MGFISLSESLELGASVKEEENKIFSSGVKDGSLFEMALEQITNEESIYREAVSKDPLKANCLTVTAVLKSAVQDITNYVDKSLAKMANNKTTIDDISIGSSIYEYSISDDIPVYMEKERDGMYRELDKMEKTLNEYSTTTEKIEAIRSARKQILEKCDSDFWSKYRGKLINTSRKIGPDSFASELFKVYRSDCKRVKVTEAMVDAAKKNVKKKAAVNKILSEKKNIIKQYDVLKEHFDKVVDMRNVRNIDDQIETLQLEMDMYLSAKANQLNKMKNLHLIAYTAKLDAIVEQYKIEQSLARLEV